MPLMKIQYLAAAAFVLSACVTASDVVPVGNNQFMVTGHASGGLNAGKGTAAAAQRAQAYCSSQGKTMVMVSTDFHGVAAVGGESTAFVFRCDS